MRKSVNCRLRNLAIARNRSGTFECNHFRPLNDLLGDPFNAVGKDDVPFGDQIFQFLQCLGRTAVSIL